MSGCAGYVSTGYVGDPDVYYEPYGYGSYDPYFATGPDVYFYGGHPWHRHFDNDFSRRHGFEQQQRFEHHGGVEQHPSVGGFHGSQQGQGHGHGGGSKGGRGGNRDHR